MKEGECDSFACARRPVRKQVFYCINNYTISLYLCTVVVLQFVLQLQLNNNLGNSPVLAGNIRSRDVFRPIARKREYLIDYKSHYTIIPRLDFQPFCELAFLVSWEKDGRYFN